MTSTTSTVINDLIAENDVLRKELKQAAGKLTLSAELMKNAVAKIESLNEQVAELLETNEELEEVIAEMTENADVEMDEYECDECDCCDENEHVNDTNANEDFLTELTLALINNGTAGEDIPEILTDVVTSIKENMSR